MILAYFLNFIFKNAAGTCPCLYLSPIITLCGGCTQLRRGKKSAGSMKCEPNLMPSEIQYQNKRL